MKYHQAILLAFLISLTLSSYLNNTRYWANKLNRSDIHYQVFSGFQEIDWFYPKGQTGMFFNLFGAAGHDLKTQDPEVPLIIWLQGGPGASSQFGAFTQIGPIRINKGKVESADNAWNTQGHLLFIDSPLNAGFSFNPNRYSDKQVSSAEIAGDHLVNFLFNFYKEWPTLKKSPLYIAGQSFAGHYIPCLGRKIINNETFRDSTGITLAGLSIGDGWVAPINQVNSYGSYLYSVGVVSNRFRDVLTWFQTKSIQNIHEGRFKNATAYFDFITNNQTTPQKYLGNISMYNFRNYNGIDTSFARFLDDEKAQFAAKYEYQASSEEIYTAFAEDISRDYSNDLVFCIKNTKVLIYNGQNDVVVNTPAMLQYLNSLNWVNIGQWKRAQKQIWTMRSQVKGWAKVYGNLWFVLVNGAGHMVPSDRPREAFNMLGHFLKDNLNWRE